MTKILLLLAGFIFATALVLQGQTPQAKPESPVAPQKLDDDHVLRITTNLIQIDAWVTKAGQPVPNLGPDDFEVLVNGKPQKITTFSFIGSDMATSPPATEEKSKPKAKADAPVLPPVRMRPEQVRRTIAFVVDDLSMAMPDITYARRALQDFVDRQLQPGDLVAIVLVGRSTGILQRFTADKRELNAAIEKIRYNLNANLAGPDLNTVLRSDVPSPLNDSGQGIQQSEADEFDESVKINTSLETLDYVLRGMRDLPGRKAVMLLSGGFPLDIAGHPEYGIRIREAVKKIVDDATRSAVVISTMDSRGLLTTESLNATASGLSPRATSIQIAQAYRDKLSAINLPQVGLKYVANQTGGIAILNANDMRQGVREMLDDLRSYYAIGFQPDSSLLNPAQRHFNGLKVLVKVSGVKVRYRSGFYGVADRIKNSIAGTPEQRTAGALFSPFGLADLDIRLTPLFTYHKTAGLAVRSLVHIGADNLTFVDRPNGVHETSINIAAVTFNDVGSLVESVGETHTLSLPDDVYRRALKSGLVYSINVPLRKSGGYQLRIAVRDSVSGKLGSASQFIEIPDIKKGKFALSGIALGSFDRRRPDASKAGEGNGSAVAENNNLLTKASARRFSRGEVLQYAYSIYNGADNKKPVQLKIAIKVFRDGKEIYTGEEKPFQPAPQSDPTSLLIQRTLQLQGLEPGTYVLQAIVTQNKSTAKPHIATNWIDFEIAN